LRAFGTTRRLVSLLPSGKTLPMMIPPEQMACAGPAIVPRGGGLRRDAGERAMTVTGILDRLFVNQLIRTNERGETIFFPFGVKARGYLVPPDREPGLRSGLRWLTFVSQFGTIALVVVVPRMIEARLGYVMPLSWFIGGALVALVFIFGAIMHVLSRLTAGLEPAPARG
jgi:hypothetical protein